MANYKAERRAERKERRKAAARQDHREKEEKKTKQIKEQNKDKPKKQTAWKRKDKNGNIVLWNAVKITKTSGYILGAMATIIILFAISPIFEDPNYVEPERILQNVRQ
jgi:predicted histidine transporter YuiF (NhaC family)